MGSIKEDDAAPPQYPTGFSYFAIVLSLGLSMFLVSGENSSINAKAMKFGLTNNRLL